MNNLPNDKDILTILEAREKLKFKQEWKDYTKQNQKPRTIQKPMMCILN